MKLDLLGHPAGKIWPLMWLVGESREPVDPAGPSKLTEELSRRTAMKHAQALICLAAVLLPAACSAAHSASSPGTVNGRLVLEGGPLGPGGQQPGTRPIPGTVRFADGHHRPVTVRTTSAGAFSVQLPAGRYQVSDRSPRVLLVNADGTSSQEWSTPVPVTITAHHTTTITLTIIVP